MREDYKAFHLPTKPYSLVDAINRAACATGSISYAGSTHYADYNGHYLTVTFNEYRGYYICEYFWAGRVVVARGNVREVLADAFNEYQRQGRGASLTIHVKPEDEPLVTEVIPTAVTGKSPQEFPEWYTWRHREAGSALWLEQEAGIPATTALLCAKDKEDYKFLCSREGRNELNNREPIL